MQVDELLAKLPGRVDGHRPRGQGRERGRGHGRPFWLRLWNKPFLLLSPDSPAPTCGWYGHHNGKCDGRDKCPDGMVEVGSNIQHCENHNYQAACCTFDTPSMKLYSQCSWAQSPQCDRGTCSNELVAESSTGSGGDFCRYRDFHYTLTGQEATYQERKYCCDQEEDTKWEDCEWYDHHGLLRVPAGGEPDGYCWSNCPSDTVRVAMETRNGCEGDGGRVKCCTPRYTTISKRSYNDAESRLEQNVKDFMNDPSCGKEDYTLSKRDLTDLSLGNISLGSL